MAPSMRRRGWLAAAARPQAGSPTPRRYAVVSLIGDELVLVYATLVTGSRLDQNAHRELQRRPVTATRLYPLAASADAVDPWDALDARQKVTMLRTLLESELRREVPALLASG